MGLKTLLIPSKVDAEREQVALAWQRQGGEVCKIDKFWEKPTFKSDVNISIYGNDTFALVLAQILGLKLISPKDELIADFSKKWLKRKVEIVSLQGISSITFPYFIKPIIPKQFSSKVYFSLEDLKSEIKGLGEKELVIASETIQIEAEVRCFILNNQIADLSLYEGTVDLNFARNFIEDFLQNSVQHTLPKTYVLDIGYNQFKGWFVIELNAAWGAGLNGCDASKVIDCIYEATI